MGHFCCFVQFSKFSLCGFVVILAEIKPSLLQSRISLPKDLLIHVRELELLTACYSLQVTKQKGLPWMVGDCYSWYVAGEREKKSEYP